MKRKILVLAVTAMMLAMMVAGSALPALAQRVAPEEPECAWYFDRYTWRVFGQEWWGYWCDWPDYGWYLHAWWHEDYGIIRVG